MNRDPLQLNHVYQGDVMQVLGTFPSGSVQTVVTSPPYWGLRDYGTADWAGGDSHCDHRGKARPSDSRIYEGTMQGKNPARGNGAHRSGGYPAKCRCGAIRIDEQLGLEPTPELYIEHMVRVFEEIKRVLRPDGTVWLNIGDSYYGGKGKSGQSMTPETQAKRKKAGDSVTHGHQQIGGPGLVRPLDAPQKGLKPGDLVGIPWRLAFALRDAGWHLRQDIIWHKPNPMPESIYDRCTKAHEYVFLLSKSGRNTIWCSRDTAEWSHDPDHSETITDLKGNPRRRWRGHKYYYDQRAIKEPATDTTLSRMDQALEGQAGSTRANGNTRADRPMKAVGDGELRNKRDVWTIATTPYKGAHFATFPKALVQPCILAGCPLGGIVLDPFIGSGTVGEVAMELHRKFVGIELKPDHVKLARKRLLKNGLLLQKTIFDE